jgi:hypothetical protein
LVNAGRLQFANSPIRRPTNSPTRQLANGLVLLFALSACSHPAAPTTAPVSVDVLTYLLGDASLWPRHGSHNQEQVVDMAGREVCWVKYGNPRRFECWRWDDEYVYHAVDHALDGDSNESYRFTDGRWLPRRLPAAATADAPWTLDVAQNQIIWYDAACQIDPARSYLFPTASAPGSRRASTPVRTSAPATRCSSTTSRTTRRRRYRARANATRSASAPAGTNGTAAASSTTSIAWADRRRR